MEQITKDGPPMPAREHPTVNEWPPIPDISVTFKMRAKVSPKLTGFIGMVNINTGAMWMGLRVFRAKEPINDFPGGRIYLKSTNGMHGLKHDLNMKVVAALNKHIDLNSQDLQVIPLDQIKCPHRKYYYTTDPNYKEACNESH